MPALTDDLQAEFLAQFLEVARARINRALELLRATPEGAATVVARELHSLAGEASLLACVEVAARARAAVATARAWEAAGDGRSAVACARAIREVARALDAVAGPPAAAAPPAPAARPEDGDPGGVLIVDDSLVNATVLQDALGREGVAAAIADTMAAAIERVGALAPRVVLADVHMPDCDVETLCARLRERAGASPPHLLLVSALSEEELAPVAARAGADGFVSKRAGLPPIVERVRALLARR